MEKTDKTLLSIIRWIIIAIPVGLIRLYQIVLSPVLGPTCRFHPTCSHYAILALKRHGLVIGSWLTIKRVLKCHPLHPGGNDPVPHKSTITHHKKE